MSQMLGTGERERGLEEKDCAAVSPGDAPLRTAESKARDRYNEHLRNVEKHRAIIRYIVEQTHPGVIRPDFHHLAKLSRATGHYPKSRPAPDIELLLLNTWTRRAYWMSPEALERFRNGVSVKPVRGIEP